MKIDRFTGEYAWLSNFHCITVSLDGKQYPTVEHAYQAAKTLNKVDRAAIRLMNTATGAKKAGKAVKLRKDWEDIKLEIMLDLLRQKFSHPHLRDKLLATESAEISEGNWWGDTFWGVDSRTGEGENYLGLLIMQVREELC